MVAQTFSPAAEAGREALAASATWAASGGRKESSMSFTGAFNACCAICLVNSPKAMADCIVSRDAAAQERCRRGRRRARQTRLLVGLGNGIAFARRQEQVGIDPVLAGIEVVITAARRIEGLVRTALDYASILHHQNLLRPPDGR